MLGGLTFDPKGLVLAHGQRRQVQLLGVRVIDEIKPVLLKDFHAVAERELLRHGEPHWQRPQQGLPVEHRLALELLVVLSLVRSMLVDDEKVVPELAYDEPQVELADDPHLLEVLLVKHTLKLVQGDRLLLVPRARVRRRLIDRGRLELLALPGQLRRAPEVY